MIVRVASITYREMMGARHRREQYPRREIDSQRIALWCDRSVDLESRIASEPDAEWAWLWRARLTVLQYLIQRYSPEKMIAHREPGGMPSESSGEEASNVYLESTDPYDHVPSRYEPAFETANETSRDFHSRLLSLKQNNAERNAAAAKAIAETLRAYENPELDKLAKTLRQLAIEQTTPKKPGQPDIAEALHGLDERGYKTLRKYIVFDLGMLDRVDEALDEETIQMILQEHGIEQDESS